MKKSFLLLSFFLFLLVAARSQMNLCPNPSFENFDTCITDQNQVHYATGWNGCGLSPDYFNLCSANPDFSVPNNWGGYQQAASGNAYCALGTYFPPIPNGRELIIAQLDSPLIIGTKYRASFKANLSISDPILANCATNKLGMLFSTISYNASNPPPISNFAHIYSTNIITDTANWTTLSGIVTADSAYKYIIIGNFFDDVNTDTTIFKNDSIKFAYYFIDDISVMRDTATGMGNEINQDYFSSNFSNGLLTINLNDEPRSKNNELIIYNLLGAEILRHRIYQKSTSISLNNNPFGFYILNITIQNKKFSQKLLLTN